MTTLPITLFQVLYCVKMSRAKGAILRVLIFLWTTAYSFLLQNRTFLNVWVLVSHLARATNQSSQLSAMLVPRLMYSLTHVIRPDYRVIPTCDNALTMALFHNVMQMVGPHWCFDCHYPSLHCLYLFGSFPGRRTMEYALVSYFDCP